MSRNSLGPTAGRNDDIRLTLQRFKVREGGRQTSWTHSHSYFLIDAYSLLDWLLLNLGSLDHLVYCHSWAKSWMSWLQKAVNQRFHFQFHLCLLRPPPQHHKTQLLWVPPQAEFLCIMGSYQLVLWFLCLIHTCNFLPWVLFLRALEGYLWGLELKERCRKWCL